MSHRFALPTRLYLAMMGVLNGDTQASADVHFENFIEALCAIGFRNAGTNTTQVVLSGPAGLGNGGQPLLYIPVPVPAQHWWPYQYASVAHELERDFNITASMFIEIDETVTNGNAIVVPPPVV
ncbi:hypothetical protein PYCCODRAFT_1468551 [Trametes coccinea BRFM310]|nr:hypothetical protein PYCCODRAFT_1472544 [Trametes coccinea BRFM310]OSD01680.1 hypothetical protein PYCCODRAFT_1468551 [Trametes coccinea BRFM310]